MTSANTDRNAFPPTSSELSIRCRGCSATLGWPDRTATRIDCACGASYRCLAGIADLRTGEDPYCGNARDGEIAADLHEHAAGMSFEGLLERYYLRHCPELRPVDVRRQLRHILTNHEHDSIMIIRGLDEIDRTTVLDLGCGCGGALIPFALTHSPENVIGTDIAMRWLVLARKRLDERGLTEVRLVCSEGESMPFATASFGLVHGGDVIEHVGDAETVLAETARVLRPGGRARFRTPNRMSLTPEPHVGLPFAGWLPRGMARAYCRLFGAPPFQGIFTRTRRGWVQAARTVSGRYPEVDFDVSAARVRTGERPEAGLMAMYDACLFRSGPFRAVAAVFGPVLEIRMEKGFERTITPAGPFGEAPGFQKGERPGQ